MAKNNQKFLPSEMCLSCPTCENSLFANVKPEDLHNMDSHVSYQLIEKGVRLFQIDEKADSLYTLHEGVLKLEQQLPTGKRRIVRLLRRGDLAGIEAVTLDKYQYDAIAMTDISICEISAESVLNFSTKSPEFHKNLLNKWQLALATSDIWLTKFSTGPARHRIVRLLIWLSENSPGEELYMPSRKEMGNMLSRTTEIVSRIIAELRRDGNLELLGANRAKANVENLKKIVKETA